MELTESDKLLVSFLESNPLTKVVLDSFNRSVLELLPRYIQNTPIVFASDGMRFRCTFSNVRQVGAADKYGRPIWPFMCRRNKEDYILKQYADIVLELYDEEDDIWRLVDSRSNMQIWDNLNMLGSKTCWLSMIDKELPPGVMRRYLDIDADGNPIPFNKRDYSLANVQDFRSVDEDPSLPLGYFISAGIPKAVTVQERLGMNMMFNVTNDKIFKLKDARAQTFDKSGSETLVCDIRSMSQRYDISHVKVLLVNLAPDPKNPTGILGHALYMCIPAFNNASTNVINMMRLYYLLVKGEGDQLNNCINIFRAYFAQSTSLVSVSKYNDNTVEDARMIGNDENLLRRYATLTGRTQFIVSDKVKEMVDISEDQMEEMRNEMKLQFFPHIDTDDEIAKFRMLADMCVQVVKFNLGIVQASNKDHYGVKRMNDPGNQIYTLNVSCYSKYIREYMRKKPPSFPNGDYNSFFRTLTARFNKISDDIHKNYSKAMWGLTSRPQKPGVVQPMSMMTMAAAYGILRRIGVSTGNDKKKNKAQKPKLIDETQYGYVCPSDTPDSDLGGMVKQLGITTLITMEESDEPIRALLMSDYALLDESESYDDAIVYVNGQFIGYTDIPDQIRSDLVQARRNNKISKFTTIILSCDTSGGEVVRRLQITTSSGRPVRPLLVVGDNNQPLYKQYNTYDFTTLLTNGAIEMLNAGELEWESIAITPDMLTTGRKFTYLEIHPVAMFGIAPSLMNLANYNQIPRVAYTANMKKQAISAANLAYINQMETGTKVLRYPQRQLLQTVTAQVIGHNEQPSEQNVVIAIMPLGYNMEDALVINRGFIQRGGLSSDNYDVIGFDVEKGAGEKLGGVKFPQGIVSERQPATVQVTKQLLDSDQELIGYITNTVPSSNTEATQNYQLSKGDIVACKTIVENGKAHEECINMTGMKGVVDKIWTIDYGARKKTNYRIRIRSANMTGGPQDIGDKMYAEYSQKGVIGMVMDETDMPRTPDGIPIDMVMNPAGFPTRMTIGYLLDMIFGLSITAPTRNPIPATQIPPDILSKPVIPGIEGKTYFQLTTNERKAFNALFSRNPAIEPLLRSGEDFPIPEIAYNRMYPERLRTTRGFEQYPLYRMAYEYINGNLPRNSSTMQANVPSTINATPFGDPNEEQFKLAQQALQERGFSSTGKTVLYSGITGRMLGTYVNNPKEEIMRDWAQDAEDEEDWVGNTPDEDPRVEIGVDFIPSQITVGVIAYKALKHIVKEKIRARDIGKNHVLTRQAIKGKSKDGGIRLTTVAFVVNKITASLHHRRRHIQTQGKSQMVRYSR